MQEESLMGISGGDQFFMSEDPRRHQQSIGEEKSATTLSASPIAKIATDIKNQAIDIFESISSEDIASSVERLIRTVEHLENTAGVKGKKFEPLRHMSGLKIREPLENANRVVDNTVGNYDMNVIESIESRMSGGRPAIAISVLGEKGGKGFLAKSVIAAKVDFNGSEAIDYVHANPAGLFSVKRFERSRWVDASDDFDIRHKIVEYELETHEGMSSTAFIGEKIASSGKEIIMKELNLTDKDVTFGKHQVFSSNGDIVDGVLKFVRAKISG
jgi:hypothetical protein